MKKKQNVDKLKIYNASHGIERKWVLEKEMYGLDLL